MFSTKLIFHLKKKIIADLATVSALVNVTRPLAHGADDRKASLFSHWMIVAVN
jgi:hypothetical protein